VELERTEIIALGAMLYLSDLTEVEAIDLAYLVGANAAGRLGAVARRARQLMLRSFEADPDVAWFEARNTIEHGAVTEREAVSSILHFNGAESVRGMVRTIQEQIDARELALIAALDREAISLGGTSPSRGEAIDVRIPVRLTRGPLDFALPASRLLEDEAAWYSSREFTLSGNARFELVNFIDGTRSVTAIRDAISAEFRPVSTAVVARYLDDLVKVGVVDWK
jgi:hypothetical protein